MMKVELEWHDDDTHRFEVRLCRYGKYLSSTQLGAAVRETILSKESEDLPVVIDCTGVSVMSDGFIYNMLYCLLEDIGLRSSKVIVRADDSTKKDIARVLGMHFRIRVGRMFE